MSNNFWQDSIELPDDSGNWQNSIDLPDDDGGWVNELPGFESPKPKKEEFREDVECRRRRLW